MFLNSALQIFIVLRWQFTIDGHWSEYKCVIESKILNKFLKFVYTF